MTFTWVVCFALGVHCVLLFQAASALIGCKQTLGDILKEIRRINR